jgi:hypothetical protein
MANKITLKIRLDDEGKEATVVLRTDQAAWEKSEPGNANNVFETKKGGYILVGDNGRSPPTELRKAGGGRVAVLYNFFAGKA